MRKKPTRKLLKSLEIITERMAYFKECYRLIAIDLSKQSNLKDPQQINFVVKPERQDNGVTMLFIIAKSKETTLEFLQNSVNIL